MTEAKYQYDHPHPAVTVDACFFSLVEGALHILLIRRGIDPFKGTWALPGGFVHIDEELDAAIERELREETGVTGFYLEQLGAFGAVNRDPRGRVITIAYCVLAPASEVKLKATTDAVDAAWYPANELPELAFDHGKIIENGKERIRERIDQTLIALEFLPDEFTLSELQSVFEAVHETSLDKRNFRKQVLARDFLEPTGEQRKGPHRPAALYCLKKN